MLNITITIRLNKKNCLFPVTRPSLFFVLADLFFFFFFFFFFLGLPLFVEESLSFVRTFKF